MCLSSRPAIGSSAEIVVLYPEVDPPYSTVFAEIISGIEQGVGIGSVPRYALSAEYDLPALKQWLERQGASAVVTLGRVATQAYEASNLKLPQVIGALDLSPQTRPTAAGISLAVDPALLFTTLKLLAPKVNRVFVVFNPNRERWIIARAQHVAATFKLTLVPLEAEGLRASAQHFQQILDTANSESDAIWLTLDNQIIDTEVILPVIIEQSWRRRLVVFSNNLEHASLGVLFALFPDNQALGRQLAEMALQLASHPGTHLGVELLHTVKRALSLRVAAHLELTIDKQVERQFDLVFR